VEGSFDYIVVGAGSAGCVLANRLTANGTHRVLLIEAGGEDRGLWIHLPIGFGKLLTDARYTWLYSSEPEAELNHRSIIQPRGKVMGGSSSINGLLYVRGQVEDFDHWRQLGNAGWSFNDVLPYFRRAEDQERGEDEVHGVGGPLSVRDVSEPHPLCEAFIEACEQAAIPRTRDFNGLSQEGAGYFQLTTRKGRRWSTARGYLAPARKRGNLAVVANALTTRILFDGRRAVGVEYRRGDKSLMARANREVILSSGAFNSPQLLQLSGIGPADFLRQHGIHVIADMKGVGSGLQDHYEARFYYRCSERITVNDMMVSMRGRVVAGLRYLLFRKGLLSIGGAYAGAFAKTGPQMATPDVQFHFILSSADSFGQKPHPWPGFLATICQLRPQSRGFVRIKSADPTCPPAIQPCYLTAEVDRTCMVAGMKLLRDVMRKDALKRYIVDELAPRREVQTDTDYLDFARREGSTVFHPTSTCRMGSDAGAVVDERLRVRGFSGLRIADASIMPTIVSGNTNAACVMIGEKASEMIRQDASAKGPDLRDLR
jgi:choline dehydrogenase